jgi:hypothetical protein
MGLLGLVAPPRVGVVVDPGVSGKLIGARELFAAARELASMGLFSGVGSDVSGLMLETVEGLVAHGALVGPGQLSSRLHVLSSGQGTIGPDCGDGSHVSLPWLLSGLRVL